MALLYSKNTSYNPRTYGKKISINKNPVTIIVVKETLVCDDALEMETLARQRYPLSGLINKKSA